MIPNTHFLFASLIWGSIGLGLFIYGKKQQSLVPLFGGLLLVGVSYFVDSALLMSASAVAILAGIWYLKRQGY